MNLEAPFNYRYLVKHAATIGGRVLTMDAVAVRSSLLGGSGASMSGAQTHIQTITCLAQCCGG